MVIWPTVEDRMTYWLLDHPNPNGPHYRHPRSGAIRVVVLHTAENNTDLDGADSGAENVAAYASSTTRQVSWHATVDADSTIRMLPDDYEAFHARGYNGISLGLEFAVSAADWVKIPYLRRLDILDRGAAVVAEWCRTHDIPPVLLSKAQVDAGHRGVTFHRYLDPGRRSDPGEAFPHPYFLRRVGEILALQAWIGTPVMGVSSSTVEQAVAFVRSHYTADTKYPWDTVETIVRTAYRVAGEEGVRADLALGLMLKETGYFRYGGDVKPAQWNFGGIGATGGVPGLSFPSIEAGVRAVVRRMRMYAAGTTAIYDVGVLGRPLPQLHWGRYPNIEDFDGVWAVPGVGYGASIVRIAEQIAATPTPPVDEQPPLSGDELGLLRRIIEWWRSRQ